MLVTLAVNPTVVGGTPTPLSATPTWPTPNLFITAISTNAAPVYVGDQNVLAASEIGIPLIAGATLLLPSSGNIGTVNATEIYIDGTTGDKVSVSYIII